MLVIGCCFAVGQTALEIAWQSMVLFNFQVLFSKCSLLITPFFAYTQIHYFPYKNLFMKVIFLIIAY